MEFPLCANREQSDAIANEQVPVDRNQSHSGKYEAAFQYW
jgi:hypothetical protein